LMLHLPSGWNSIVAFRVFDQGLDNTDGAIL